MGENQGIYIVKFLYACLQTSNTMTNSSEFNFILFWSVKALSNAKTLTWRVINGKVPTRTNLVIREVQLKNEISPLCLEHPETVKHLFLSCDLVFKVWSDCDKWIGVQTIYHGNLMTHFLQFH